MWQASQLAPAVAPTIWYGTWLADLPSAGGNAPVWQLAHCAVTGTWLWLKLLGFQALVLWQATQLVVPTGTCLAGLAVAPLAPVWQLVQLVAALNLL